MIAHPNPIRALFWAPGVLVLAFLMGAGAIFHRQHRLCIQPEYRPPPGNLDKVSMSHPA